MKKHLLTLDLQLFADDEGFGGYDPSTIYDGIEPAPEQPPAEGDPTQPQTPGAPETPPQPELLDFGGRKIQANEDLLGLHKDYTEQQRYITALQEQVNAYKQFMDTFSAQGQPQGQPQQPQAPSPQDFYQSLQESWGQEAGWEKFYEKPVEQIAPIVEAIVSKMFGEKVEPIIQERQWNQEIQRMYDSYPDFDQFIGDVQELVNQFPDRYAGRDGGLEEAYFRAKASKNTNPEQLVQDPNFVQQYVLSNPQIQQQLLSQYMATKQQQNQQLPVNMGRGAGGFTPQTPENAPQTLKEASKVFLKQLGY